ncbi:YaiI/YqxD family protein [Paludicola sp. MB14-C6]|uniref:YaiI/YqxD family protein n=1 Tax=Paludihabitans sp. MB14-C6 TaxID=3070656 RepID=UPI0027DD622C|nr:YaiI/YqxD family protein [Paludicola sp. MB14-C6]WMJ22805.1 YaiI/YqxD family protein [Paludicola sp. MB14-C6]
MSRILIDADGCPVVDITIKVAKEFSIEVMILCDTSHFFERNGATTITVSKGADSVDFKLANMIEKGDIVVTQDYGLAAMCLAKNALVLNQNGMQYTNDNIDALLLARHTAKKIRNSGGRLKGNKKRTEDQNEAFEKALRGIIASRNI